MPWGVELVADEDKPSKWVVTLGGGEWGTVKYGVVEYLRKRPRMRAATAVTGVLWVAGWLASMAGFKWQSSFFPTISTIFVTPTLLWFAVVSGSDFSLAFEKPKIPDPPKPPPVEVKGVLDAEGYGLEALNKSYDSAESYGRSSFRWAMFSLVVGVAVASGNAWLISFGGARFNIDHAALFIWILSAMSFFLCTILLVRSMIVFRRATVIHDKLLDLQKTITVMKFLERSNDPRAVIDPSIVVARLLSPSGINETK
jgi:hypothetical protein